ncbi:MAG: hypothetical protein B1H03_04965 [Planctomycetales bacterium 4484_113]|nr:MAG: hypothetical protein B1H03_04965 [Planctomycetales bacterium 4484_113]
MERFTRILVGLFLVLGIAGSCVLLAQRIAWDRAYRKVLLVYDSAGFSRLAQQGVAVRIPSPAGIAVNEATVRELRERGYMQKLELMADQGRVFRIYLPVRLLFCDSLMQEAEGTSAPSSGRTESDAGIPESGRLAEVLAGRVRRSLAYQLAGGYDVQASGAGDHVLLLVKLPPVSEEEENALALDFYLRPEFPLPVDYAYVFRPTGNGLLGPSALAEKFAAIPQDAHRSSLTIFSGTRVPGYPGNLGDTARLLSGDLGMVEFSEIAGLKQLAHLLTPRRVFWVHTIPPEEIVKMSPQAMLARYLRAVKERNPRVLYIHPLAGCELLPAGGEMGKAIGEQQKRFIHNLRVALEGRLGFELSLSLENPHGDAPLLARACVLLLAYLALAAFVVMFLPGRRLAGFLLHPATMLVAAVLAFALVWSSAWRDLTVCAGALVVALLAPLIGFGLALGYLTEGNALQRRKCLMPLGSAFIAFGLAFLTALAGGLIVHALMHSIGTFTRMEAFHGVMLSRGLPVLVVLAYTYNLGTLSWQRNARNLVLRLQRLLGYDVSYLDLTLLVVLLAALALALLRAGNEFGILVTAPEHNLRSGMEALLGLRPRTAELVGSFALIWFFLVLPWRHRASLLLLAAGTLGLESVINTYSHLHTPLLVSISRTSLGLLLSLVVFLGSYVAFLLLRALGRMWWKAGMSQ